jgi:ketosteroid isomerase-like protein
MSTVDVVRAYYESWQGGPAAYDQARLRGLLADDIAFEGPLAGKVTGAEAVLPGIERFVGTVRSLRMLQLVCGGDEAAAVYDCELAAPSGVFRFAEFFRVGDGKIQQLRLLFDTVEFRKLAARSQAA